MNYYHYCIIDASRRRRGRQNQRFQFKNTNTNTTTMFMYPFNLYYQHAGLILPPLSSISLSPLSLCCIRTTSANHATAITHYQQHHQQQQQQQQINEEQQEQSCITPVKKLWPFISIEKKKKGKQKNNQSDGDDDNNNKKEGRKRTPRIAIIGGGLCGVTAAKSIVDRLSTTTFTSTSSSSSGHWKNDVDITIYEADVNSPNGLPAGGEESENKELDEGTKSLFKQPKWKAAAARNANSLVPGASMHIMSQRDTIFRIIKDHIGSKPAVVFTKSPGDDFSEVPPYFGLNMWRCIGLSVPWEERFSFFQFMYHFLKASLFSNSHDVKLRGKYLVQLANANTYALSKDLQKENGISNKLGLSSGFIAVHRTKGKAINAVQEAQEFGEVAEILSLEDAIKLEPKIQNLPFSKSFFVYRPNDKTANCLEYLNGTIKALLVNTGIKYKNDLGNVTGIEQIHSASRDDGRFKVTTDKGTEDIYDYIILANGVRAPLLMLKLGVQAGRSCPTYPLKGYSLTLSVPRYAGGGNYLNKPLSFDNMYCTSVGGMVRLAGFGEIAGFPHREDYLKGSPNIARSVLHRYATAVFGNELCSSPDLVIPCFRPFSPDDLPLVGKVKSVPGLFLHHGHGTLGWSMSLATSECLAQDVCDVIEGIDKKKDFFVLSNGTRLPKSVLSPDRFL